MFAEHLCTAEEQPNTAVTVSLCLWAGYEGSDLCPSFHHHVKLHNRDFQHFWRTSQRVGWEVTFDLNICLFTRFCFYSNKLFYIYVIPSKADVVNPSSPCRWRTLWSRSCSRRRRRPSCSRWSCRCWRRSEFACHSWRRSWWTSCSSCSSSETWWVGLVAINPPSLRTCIWTLWRLKIQNIQVEMSGNQCCCFQVPSTTVSFEQCLLLVTERLTEVSRKNFAQHFGVVQWPSARSVELK